MNIDSTAVEGVIRSVRNIVLPHWGSATFTAKSEHAHDLVTELDVKVEEMLKAELAKLYPEVAFVGEETGGDRTAEKLWLCDPIDGTVHFIRGMPFCSTMLAYIENGRVMASWIYLFVDDVLYHAVRGGGAFRDNTSVHVSERALAQSYMGWETHSEKPENMEKHLQLSKVSSFFKTVNAGYEFCLVADGRLEGRICFDPWGKDYDFAPGSLLVEEAGGVVANIGSRDYDYTNLSFLACNPIVFKELTEGQAAIFPLGK
jgi:myo-inositol-1(or 4)-monophosphatase